MTARGILLLAFMLPSLPVCLVRPFYGVLLWTVVAFASPQWYTWSSARAFPWAMAIAIPTIIGLLLFCHGWMRRIMSGETLLLAALWVWFTITSVVSSNTALFAPHAADTWTRWEFVSKVLLMTVVICGVVDTFGRLRTLLQTIALCFGAFILKAIPFMIATHGQYRLYGPPHSMIEDNNDFGLALDMALPLFFFLAQTESRRWVRTLFMSMFVFTIPAILFTYSRGAMVGLVVLLGLMLLRLKQRRVLIPVLLLAAIVAFVFAPESWKERMDPSRPDVLDASARSRLNAWTYSWRLARESPVTGGGFDTFTPELFQRYAPNPEDVHGPHSVYFGVLAEHGFPGLFLYLSLILSCFLTTRKLAKTARSEGEDVVAGYANMLQFSLIGFLIPGTFLGRAYFDFFFTIVACIVILKRLCIAAWSEAADPEPNPAQELTATGKLPLCPVLSDV